MSSTSDNQITASLITMLQAQAGPAMLARLDGPYLDVLASSPALTEQMPPETDQDAWGAVPQPFAKAIETLGQELEGTTLQSLKKKARTTAFMEDGTSWQLDARFLDEAGHVLINMSETQHQGVKDLARGLSMELLVAFMEGADRHAVVMIREDGRISGWNISAERLSGAKGDQARGHYFDEFFDLAIVREQRLMRILREAKSKGLWKAPRSQVRRFDGSVFTADIAIRPLEGQSNKMATFAVTIEDLTDVIAREDEIRDSHARFRDFAESTSDWFWVMDRDLRVVEIHPEDDPRFDAIRKLYLGKAPFQIAAMSDDAVGWWQHLSDLREQKSFRDFHYVVPLARGRKIHVAESGRPIYDRDGNFIGYRGAARNVTAEVVGERDRRQREQRLIAAVDAANNAVLAFDTRMQLALWNGRTPIVMPEWIGGLQIGMTWTDFLLMIKEATRPEDRDKYAGLIAALDEHDALVDDNGMNPAPFTRRIEQSDGRWLEYGRYVTEEGGAGLSVTDVTADETTQSQQRQAFKMEALGQLTGGVAHDFNNLLTVIRGNLEMLEMGLEASVLPERLDKVSRRVEAATEAADRGAALTQRLLGFARKQPTEARIVDLDAHLPSLKVLIDQAVGRYNPVTITAGDNLGNLRMDPAEFDNAVLNLAINARDASEVGRPISVTVTRALPSVSQRHFHAHSNDLDLSKDYICVNVVDSGSGIPEEIRDRIFDPFFTTKGPEKGSGLGLSMVYGFARQAGGTATVKSERGKGSAISIFLPTIDAETSQQPTRQEDDTPSGNGEIVLLVEDHEGVQALIKSMLDSLNYKVVTADNGITAKTMIDDGLTFDILLSDMSMPMGVSGTDVVRYMRDKFPHRPALILSAHSDIVSEDARKDLSPMPILDKPVSRAELARALRDAVAELTA